MRGVKSISTRVGGRPLFEIKYYGPFATYRFGSGAPRWTIRPLANRKARKAIEAAFRKADQK